MAPTRRKATPKPDPKAEPEAPPNPFPYCTICGRPYPTDEAAAKCYQGHQAARVICVAEGCPNDGTRKINGRWYCGRCAEDDGVPKVALPPVEGADGPPEEEVVKTELLEDALADPGAETQADTEQVQTVADVRTQLRERLAGDESLFEFLNNAATLTLDLQQAEQKAAGLRRQLGEVEAECRNLKNQIRARFIGQVESYLEP